MSNVKYLTIFLCLFQAAESAQVYCNGADPCNSTLDLTALKTNISQGRLPETLSPVHYNIELQPYINTGEPPFLFRGLVEIYFDVLTPTTEVYLNQKFIETYNFVNITVSEDSPIQPDDPSWRSYAWQNDLEIFVLYLNTLLVVGARYKITIEYESDLRHPGVAYGLYWDSYVDNENITKYVVASQYQSSYTRYMMPCFDEPVFKSTYNVTLVRQANTMSLSNMPLLSQEEREDGWVADTFEQSITMSSYLLCMVIGDFDYLETVTNKGVSVRIWARPDALYAAEFANSFAANMLEWFEDYTGIDYPLSKLDHIALPTKNGAMENWGLSTYGEGFLLYDPTMSVSSSRQLVTEVVAHETAHMWFGNLVTCLYWNHTWLNEGFANYFQFQPLLDVLGLDGFDLQVPERLMPIIDDDSVNTSLPVRIEAENVDDGFTSFSSFTYSKGGSILRMINQIIGRDTFQRGISRYLNRFAYGSATTDDLWEALNEQILEDGITDPDGNPIDIKEKMDPWIDQRGHPVVTVDRETPGVLGLSQDMFFNPDGQEANTPSEWDYLWNIPITFTSQSNPEVDITTKVWNDGEERIEITEGIPDESEWILLNPSYTGFYRVLYSQADQIALVEQLLNGYQQILEDGITDPDGNPIDIKEKMDPWIDQRGHPVVTVDRETPGVLGLSQDMFFNPDGQEANTPSEWDYLWNIPITFTSQSNPEVDITTKVWNDGEERIEITEGIPDESEWILLNPSYTGFYRVLYSQADQIALVEQLLNGYQNISLNSRAQLISDAFQLARGNYQTEVRAMEFTRYLGQDLSYNPWVALDRNLGYQALMLNKFNDTKESLPAYMLSIVDPVYSYLGWESDGDHLTDRLRQLIISIACSFNDEDCLQQSQDLYAQYQTDISNNPIEPNQRGTVYCTAIRTGSQGDWDFAFNLYQSIADEIVTKRRATYERQILIPAMACTSDEGQMLSYLDATYDSTIIRTRDAQSAMLSISRSDIGRPLVWERLSDNWRNEPVPQGVSKNAVFNEIIASFNTEDELTMLNNFIVTYPPVDEDENGLYTDAIDTVQRNIQWVEMNKDELHGWFERFTPALHKTNVLMDSGVYQIYSAFTKTSNELKEINT